MKLRKIYIVKPLMAICLITCLLFCCLPSASAADFTVSDETELLAALGTAGTGDTITLDATITTTAGIDISFKNITFNLGSHDLNIVEPAGAGLTVTTGRIAVTGTGKLNVTGSTYGLFVGAASDVTVSNATCTGSGQAVHAQGGSMAIILDDVTGNGTSAGIVAVETGTIVSVGRDVISVGEGIVANNDSEVNVIGNVQSSTNTGCRAFDGGSITVHGSVVSLTNDGAQASTGGIIHIEHNVQGVTHGTYASGTNSMITISGDVQSSSATSYGACAFGGALISVGQDAEGGAYGAFASGTGSNVSVMGNVSATDPGGIGTFAYEGGFTSVNGNTTGGFNGAAATEDGFAQIGGDATATVAGGIGAYAYGVAGDTGIVTVNGTISGTTYIRVGTVDKTAADTQATTTRLDYSTYSDITGNTVWVAANVTSISAAPVLLASSGGNSIITITGTGNDLPSGIDVIALDGSNPTAVTGTTAGSTAEQTVTLSFPANTSTSSDKVYTIRASYAGTPWMSNTVNVTVEKAAAVYVPPVMNSFTVKFETNGGNTIANQTVGIGAKATEPSPPVKEGYVFDGWYADLALTIKFDFSTAIRKDTTLYAKWTKNHLCTAYTDISSHWAKDNICFAIENGLISGTTDTTFSPDMVMTRGMLVTVLWRLAGSPVETGDGFNDVTDDAWYGKAVAWASKNNIVGGYGNGSFGPADQVTREQFAVILYNYAVYKGRDVSESGTLNSFSDGNLTSSWAQNAMQWAVGAGLLKGKDGGILDAQGISTRAEVAVVLQRFIQSATK